MPIKTTSVETGCTRIAVTGAMTVYEANDDKRSLLHALASADSLEIDLLEVDEFDTSGLQLLVLTEAEGRRNGKPVRVAARSPVVIEVLERYGLAARFESPAPPR